jgi:hypothetical protein
MRARTLIAWDSGPGARLAGDKPGRDCDYRGQWRDLLAMIPRDHRGRVAPANLEDLVCRVPPAIGIPKHRDVLAVTTYRTNSA